MITRDWPGATVVCIATGPSLTQEQCELVCAWRMRCAGKVIAVNDAYLWAPWADVLYFADHAWWKWQNDGIAKLGMTAAEVRARFQEFRGRKISIENAGSTLPDDVLVLRDMSVVGGTMGRLSTDPGGIYTGRNSGYQAIEAAVLMGATRIVLLGYDMKPDRSGRNHFFGEHPTKSDPATYRDFRVEFDRMAPTAKKMGIEILNATADSDLEAFPRVSLESLVADSRAACVPA